MQAGSMELIAAVSCFSHQPESMLWLQIKDLQTITHRDTGKPKGVFVEFATPDDLSNALQAEGTVSAASFCCLL